MKTGAFLLLSFLLLSSCDKDTVASNRNKLARILLNGTAESEYFYDDAGKMTRSVSYLSGAIESEINNTYDNSGRLTRQAAMQKLNFSDLSSGVYSYSYTDYSYGTDGRVTGTVTYSRINNAAYQLAGKSVPAYDAEGRTIAITLYDTNNIAFAKRTYAYNAQDNISAEEYFQYKVSTQGPNWHAEYTYDDKKNPLEGSNWAMPYGVNKNNITARKVTGYVSLTGDHIPAGLAPVTTKIIYKSYTSNGYPAIVDEYNDGTDRVYEYN